MTSEISTKRGEIGQRTFDAVHALVHKSGMKTTEAFRKVAEETGRSVGTVQTSYYRVARLRPDSGVRLRPRTNKTTPKRTVAGATRAARTPRSAVESQAEQLNAMAHELEDRAKNLRAIAASIAGLEADAEKARRISHLLK